MLSSMPDEFISRGISSEYVFIENDSSECKDYGTDLLKNNDENNLHQAIRAANINELGILSSCIYINVNKSRQNL